MLCTQPGKNQRCAEHHRRNSGCGSRHGPGTETGSEAATPTSTAQVGAPSESDGGQASSQAPVTPTPRAPPLEITSPDPQGAVLRLGLGQGTSPGIQGQEMWGQQAWGVPI